MYSCCDTCSFTLRRLLHGKKGKIQKENAHLKGIKARIIGRKLGKCSKA